MCVCVWVTEKTALSVTPVTEARFILYGKSKSGSVLVRYVRGHIPVKITLSTNYSICCLQPDLKIQIIRIAIHSKIKLRYGGVTEECMDFNRNSRQFFLYSWKADIYWKAAGFTGDWGWFSINSERCLHLEAELVGRKRNPIRHIHG